MLTEHGIPATTDKKGWITQALQLVPSLDPNDAKNYIGTADNWNLAIKSLENALKRRDIAYKTIPGEAAFYGPKIDVKLVDAIGRLWQLSTVQFDFTLPERFEPRISRMDDRERLLQPPPPRGVEPR